MYQVDIEFTRDLGDNDTYYAMQRRSGDTIMTYISTNNYKYTKFKWCQFEHYI